MADLGDFRYFIEWEAATGIRADEHRATWARFELWIGDECVTQVEDKVSGSARRSIYISLYPLAEWIAFNWWQLRYGYRSAWAVESARGRDRLYKDRVWSSVRSHRVREAGDGFLWPDLAILPEDDEQTLLVWRKDESVPDGWSTRFIAPGVRRAPSREITLLLSTIVEEVVQRLREQGISKCVLMDEWERISASGDNGEADFCVAAAQLGIDPYSEDAISLEEGIVRASSNLTDEVLADFLGVARSDALEEEIDWILSAADDAVRSRSLGTRDIPEIPPVDSVSFYGNSPWRLGWQDARSVRSALNLTPTDGIIVEDWISTVVRPIPNLGMRALGFVDGSNVGRIVLGKEYREKSRRFTAARAIWHFARRSPGMFLVVASYGLRQKMERAFAAEFLAPADGIRQIISDPTAASVDEVENAAENYNVSPLVIQHQIENQLSGTVFE